jgi:hypothetical protein
VPSPPTEHQKQEAPSDRYALIKAVLKPALDGAYQCSEA